MRYRGWIADTRRWRDFPQRAGDVVIAVPSKSGTTWMQTIVALLVFDGLPDVAVSDLSPWLDMHVRTTDEVFATLAAQRHRRFIKTHAPLDGLPFRDEVTYIDVGRDPRDVFVSMRAQLHNLAVDTIEQLRVETADLDELGQRWPDTHDPRRLVAAFLDMERHTDHGDVNLANLVHHHGVVWQARHRPNVHLAHFVDLHTDLVGEMCRVRDVLAIDLSDDRVAQLAERASLESMRSRADRAAPEATLGTYKDAEAFFRGGRLGDGAAAMTRDEVQRYHRRCAELVDDPDLIAWMHGGRTAADPDA